MKPQQRCIVLTLTHFLKLDHGKKREEKMHSDVSSAERGKAYSSSVQVHKCSQSCSLSVSRFHWSQVLGISYIPPKVNNLIYQDGTVTFNSKVQLCTTVIWAIPRVGSDKCRSVREIPPKMQLDKTHIRLNKLDWRYHSQANAVCVVAR